MKDGFNMEVPVSRGTDAALAFLLRALACAGAFLLGCWGLAALITALRWW